MVFFNIDIKKVSGVGGAVKARSLFCTSVVVPPTRVVVAVSRRKTSDNVMAPLPASAARAFSNSWLFCRM